MWSRETANKSEGAKESEWVPKEGARKIETGMTTLTKWRDDTGAAKHVCASKVTACSNKTSRAQR
jgi:hypothetical protein